MSRTTQNNFQPGQVITSMPTRQVPITASNDTVYSPTVNVFVAVTGDVVIEDAQGTIITYPALAAGTYAPCRARKVRVGTTATVVGVW
jgi:hypothetical protein